MEVLIIENTISRVICLNIDLSSLRHSTLRRTRCLFCADMSWSIFIAYVKNHDAKTLTWARNRNYPRLNAIIRDLTDPDYGIELRNRAISISHLSSFKLYVEAESARSHESLCRTYHWKLRHLVNIGNDKTKPMRIINSYWCTRMSVIGIPIRIGIQ